MISLGIDTSGERLHIGVSKGGRDIYSRAYKGKQPHSVVILDEIEKVLEETEVGREDLSLVAATGGPGRYTALRVGLATAKGLAMALNIPFVMVSTLYAWVYSILPFTGKVAVVMDARRRLVYFALFETKGEEVKRIEKDKVVSYQQAAALIPDGGVVLGDGVSLVRPFLQELKKDFLEISGDVRGGIVAMLGSERYEERPSDDLFGGPFYIRGIEIQSSLRMERR